MCSKLSALFRNFDPTTLVFVAPMLPLRVLPLMGMGYTSSSDTPVHVPLKISEERYRLNENYKVTLVSVFPGYGKEHYYTSDLSSNLERNDVKVYSPVCSLTAPSLSVLANGSFVATSSFNFPRRFLGITLKSNKPALPTLYTITASASRVMLTPEVGSPITLTPKEFSSYLLSNTLELFSRIDYNSLPTRHLMAA